MRQTTKYSLLDDFPSVKNYKDLYGRSGYANHLANHILETSSEASFAIGIIGDWGAGKSDFMLRLKSALDQDEKQENIIFDFNPWRVNKADGIIEEFFKTLSKKLKPYNQSISTTIREYSNRVLKTAKETHFRLIEALVDGWFNEEDIQDKYEIINEAIKATSKRLIVFIDDVDRLTGKEVIEVLRVIRNTANFSNTFFIVGIDQSYIINVLKNTKDFTNEEEYLKKVFQLTITLPAFKKDVFISEIRNHLFTSDLEEEQKKKIQLALSQIGITSSDEDNIIDNEMWHFPNFHHEVLLEKLIDNVRDLKRFCNSFKIVFNILKNETEISDLIVLELIRNKNIIVYNNIRNRNILTIDLSASSNKLILDEEKWKDLQKELSESDRSVLKDALNFLFTDKKFKNQRKLILIHNFYIYFSYQLFNLISFHDFNTTLQKNADEIVSDFKKWISEDNKERELSQIFTYLDDFKNVDDLKKITSVLLRIHNDNSDWFEHVKNLLVIGWKYNHNRYFQSDVPAHKKFLYSIFDDEKIDILNRTKLVNSFSRAIIDDGFDENGLFFTKDELKKKIYYLFDQYLNADIVNLSNLAEFYHLNTYTVKDNKAIYYPPSSRIYKKFLLINDQGFKEYVRKLLRPSQLPYNGLLVLDPWLEEIFLNWKNFEDKLNNISFDDENFERLKSIILKYGPTFISSGRKPIDIKDGDEKEFIDRLLNFGFK